VALAQQRSGGHVHIYMYNPTCEPIKADRLTQLHEFENTVWNTVLMNGSASEPLFQRPAFGSR